jgi:hypothetical protein
MFKKSLVLLIFLEVLSFTKSYSQPSSTVSLTGGYTFPLGVLYAKFGNSLDSLSPDSERKYYLTYGYNYGVNYKLGLGKKRHFRITGSLNFTILGQSKDYSQASVKLRQNILSIGFGGEWNLAPKKTWLNPFAGAEFDFNFLGGNFTRTDPTTTTTLTQNSTVRYGVSLGGGMDIQFHQSVGAIVGIKYYMANLFGKKYQTDLATTYGLNDAEHTNANGTFPARSINVFQIYGGFSYYFGR